MTLRRRQFLQLAAAAAALPAVARVARADTYPVRPVRIVVGFPPGSATDTDMRLIAAPLSQRLGQEFIVDNKPGAGSNLAAEAVSRASPDGYTLLAMTVTNAVNATLYQNLAFDIQKDIAPVISTFESPNTLAVNPSVPAKTLQEFIAYAKANPGKINYASFGVGSAPNMNGELLKLMAGIDLVHVPYRQSPVPDLLSGQVQAFFGPMPITISFVKTGKLHALAVSSAKRSPALPDVPAAAEVLPGFEANIWHGIGAPKGTPPEIVAKLNKEINGILATPEIKEKFANIGGTALGGTPEEYGKFVAAEIEKWGKVIKAANIKPVSEH
ncbi:MAG TPA: tripartite tricarboxylate transporter substrate binding protein [Pseudolabrys sp.]|jgi:tripartite-type tricarboxylate transporter receptor subunit TctC